MTGLRRRTARGALAALAATAVLGLAACGSTAGSGGAASPGATAAAGTVTAPAVLQFKAPQLGGGTVDGTAYTGKPVAFWFWAPW